MNIFIVGCAVVGYIKTEHCELVVCCGLLAKWLRVRVKVRVKAGARECTKYLFFFFFFSPLVLQVW